MQFIVDLMLVTVIGLSVQSSCSAQSSHCSIIWGDSLRLYNAYGSTATQGGMLQTCISNQWRAVCDYSFSCSIEGKVACRQLGYSGSQIRSIVMLNSAQYFGTWSYTDSYYYYSCSSSYSSLDSCSRSSAPSLCGSNDQVGLQCMTLPSTECSNRGVRLVGGQSSNEGRLEYCYNGAWTQLCTSNFHIEEAVAACRQLGYTDPKAAIFTDGQFGKESNYSLVNYFSCPSPSSIRNLSSCSLHASCGYRCTGNNVGISCYVPGQDGCREGAVRLVNSTTEYEGRVEVCLDGVWGTVCGVDYSDATVICRIVGFDGVLEYYSTNQMFGDGGRAIYYNLYCRGCESNIKVCSKSSYPNTYCNRGSVAGVRCHHGCTDGEVRLIGGSSETEGTVEVCHNKTWGMVSGLGWGEEDARVTCRQLQLPVEGFHSYANSPFGKPRRTVHFSAVRCVGSESRITDCPTTNYTYEQGRLLAGHLAVAGVTCKRHCQTSASVKTVTQIVTACPRTVDLSPTLQAQPGSVTDSSQQTVTTILLTGLSAILGTVTATLAVCMCYSFYKIGKNKGLNGGSQGQVDNQYCDRQTNEMSPNAITQNASYATSPSYIEGCHHTVYEDIRPR